MDARLLQELEAASQILLAPPNLVNSDQRHAAEAVFINFKKIKTPYIMCKQFLETSRVDYVLFEVAGLVKVAIVKEWPFLQESDRTSLREYLFNYVVERPTTAAFVRERILQVIAIMVKREDACDMGASRTQLLDQIENLVLNGDHARQILGCHMMSTLMQEYAVTFKSSDIGLRWEEHFRAKKAFEVTDLKRIFQFCCRGLNSLINSVVPLNQQGTALLKSLLALSENVLSWNFVNPRIHRRCRGLSETAGQTDSNTSLRLFHQWQDVILSPQVVDLFYTIYWKIRPNPQLAHHGMTCLVQLASLNGPVFPSKETRQQYFINYLQNFIKLVTSVTILDREALGISNIILKFLIFFPPAMLADSPSDVMQPFLEQFTKLTCDFAEGAAAEESMCAEDHLFTEGFDRVMEAWLVIFVSTDTVSIELQSEVARRIFQTYVRLHIAPPEGSRGSGRELETEELDESDEPDRIRYRDQLQSIGVLGRIVPGYSLPLLSQLLEERTRRLAAVLDKLHQRAVTISDNNAVVLLFEDIHWLLLITGSVVAMYCEGETNTVPSELMRHSIKQAANLDVSLRVFGSPSADIRSVSQGEEQTDDLLRVTAASFRLAEVLKKAMEAKLVQLLSPEVASSLLWILHLWSSTYLLMDEELYTDLSRVLVAAHGRDSDGGIWALRFLYDQVHCHLTHFHSEPAVNQDSVRLLLSLVQTRDKRNALIKCEGLNSLIEMLPQLPTFVKRGVYKALAITGIAVKEGNSDSSFWIRLVEPLQDRFKALASCNDPTSPIKDENVKADLLDIFECLIGLTSGAHSLTVQPMFEHISPMISQLPAVLNAFHNYQAVVESLLSLLCEIALCLVTFLTRSETRRFYQTCLETVQTYAKWNHGRLSLQTEAQDETFQDIVLLLSLFCHLLSKDLIDLAPHEPGDENEPLITASDVCLSGLNIIMPLMTLELLKFPTLCIKYYELLSHLSDTFPEKILQLPESLLKPILTSIELGLNSFGDDIVFDCCNFIELLGTYINNQHQSGGQLNPILKPFLKLIFKLVLSQQINPQNVPNTSRVLFILMCCYREEYESFVSQLIASEDDPAIAERLARAFNTLTGSEPLMSNLRSRFQFRSNFEKFIIDAHGFLFVK